MTFRRIHLLLFGLLGGILLSLGWPERGFPGLLFIGLVPMLWIEEYIRTRPERFIRFSLLFYLYPGFFLWNLLTTWWIVNSTVVGAILAVVLNSLFMAIIFQAYHWSRKKIQGEPAGCAILLSYWIAFEYLHLNWDLNWPWLNLGNGFANRITWIQWYEYTGAIGGTVWVLIANFLALKIFKLLTGRDRSRNKRAVVIPLTGLLLWIAIPTGFSLYIFYSYSEKPAPVECVIVQPNIDPYSEQYELPPIQVVDRIMALAEPKLDNSVNFLVAPESAIQENMWENDMNSFITIRLLDTAISRYPQLNLIIGGSTFYQLHPDEPLPRWARKFTDSDQHYVAYNAAILINQSDSLQLYHKSKLTPGVEILPSFPGFKWLENFAIDLGGTVGSLGMDAERKVFHTEQTVKAGPVICYESIFGEFFSRFVKNGAEVMMIITNDGWWGETAGHRQHFSFARLRAIETRRSIVRSANTGISALIDQRGISHNQTQYWEPAVIRGSVNANREITFYVQHGDYIARVMSYLAGLLFFSGIAVSVRKKIRPEIIRKNE